MKMDGTIQNLSETALINVTKTENVTPLMILTNFGASGFSSDIAHAIFIDTNVQDKLIDNILHTMNQKGYKNLNIDFEYLYQQDKENYNAFLRRVVGRLHPLGYPVSILKYLMWVTFPVPN